MMYFNPGLAAAAAESMEARHSHKQFIKAIARDALVLQDVLEEH
jgi:hypothetical protein